jgi:hypothetical protein
MNLKEFTSREKSKLGKLTRALAENYDYNMKFEGMTRRRASKMAMQARQIVTQSNNLNKRIKFNMIAESLDLWMQANIQTELTSYMAENLDDESMEEAKVILAARELSDKIQGMIEDSAKMQVQDLLPIVDAMKSEVGASEAEAFASAADAALAGLVEALKGAKDEYDGAIAVAQGQEITTDMDLDMDGIDGEFDMDDEFGMDADGELDMDDEFGGDGAAVGGDNPLGREMKDEV